MLRFTARRAWAPSIRAAERMRLSARTGFAAASYPGGALDSRCGAQAASVRTATRRVALRSFELPVAPSTRAADAAFHRKARLGALDSRCGAQAASVRTATRRVALRSFELPVAPSTRAADAAFHRKAKSGRLGALDSRCFIRPVVAQRTMDMLGNHRFLTGGYEMAELGAQQWVVGADWVLWPSFES